MPGKAATPAAHTFLEAAVAVLRGLLATKGKTPDGSMSAVLYDAEKKPETSIVRLHDPGESRARRGSVRWALREAK